MNSFVKKAACFVFCLAPLSAMDSCLKINNRAKISAKERKEFFTLLSLLPPEIMHLIAQLLLGNMLDAHLKPTELLHEIATIKSLSFSPDDKMVLIGSLHKVILLDMLSRVLLKEKVLNFGTIKSAQFGTDTETIFINSKVYNQCTISSWDTVSEKTSAIIEKNGDSIIAVHSPNKELIFLCSHNLHYLFSGSTAIIWNISQEKKLEITTHSSFGIIKAASFSPDNKRLLAGSTNRTACLWDVTTGMELKKFESHDGPVVAVAFSPNGKMVLTCSTDYMWPMNRTWSSLTGGPSFQEDISDCIRPKARLWDTSTGKLLKEFDGHTNTISACIFSPDGRTILTCSHDETTRLWDITSGNLLSILQVNSIAACSAAFSHDGKTVLTGSYDGKVYLWRFVPCDAYRLIMTAIGPLGAWFINRAVERRSLPIGKALFEKGHFEYTLFKTFPKIIRTFLKKWYAITFVSSNTKRKRFSNELISNKKRENLNLARTHAQSNL